MPVAAVAGEAQGLSDREARPSAGGNIFTRKYGPLPGWAWSVIIAGGVLAFVVWRQHSASGVPADPTEGATTDGLDYSGELSTLQAEIQGLQGTASKDLDIDTKDLAEDKGPNRPHPPGKPHTVSTGRTVATVGWSRVKGATAYHVRRDGHKGVLTPATRHSFSGMRPGTHHTWSVRAITKTGVSAWAHGDFTTDKHHGRRARHG